MRRKKAKAKNNLRNKSVARKLVMARRVLRSIAKLVDFTDRVGAVSKLQASYAELRQASVDVDVLKSALKAARSRRDRLLQEFNRNYGKVTIAADSYGNGNPARLALTGVDYWVPGTSRRKTPKQITGLKAIHGQESGSILLTWRTKERLWNFQVEMTTDPTDPGSWKYFANSSKTKIQITGLTSGQRYWFRVSGMWRETGPPSQPVGIVAP